MDWLRQTRAKEDKRRQHVLRVKGYDDGYRGRGASLLDAAYQAGWRRGREARAKDSA